MRFLVITLCCLLMAGQSPAQFSDLEKEFAQFEQTHNDSLTKAIYIDSVFCAQYQLENVTRNFKRMNVWNNKMNYDSKDFIRVCDIRWLFTNKDEALAFFKKYLRINAEYGEEIKKAKIKIRNTQQMKIFRESAGARKINESLGLSMNYYYFLFVIDNCVAKVFVCTKPDVTVKEAAVFAKEAAGKIQQHNK